MISRKGISFLLDGWRVHINSHPEDRLLLVGEGPELEIYKEDSQKMSSVIFTGGVDYAEIHKYYAISDVFIIPTLEDNWSLVVPEAMACGLPIACSIYNGCHPELVHKDINGVTFDPLEVSSVVETLDYFHHVDLKTFGEASKKIEKDYNPEKTANNIMRAVNKYMP